MNVKDLIMGQDGVRVSFGDRWLIHDCGMWVVLGRHTHRGKTIELIETTNEEEAVSVLVKEDW